MGFRRGERSPYFTFRLSINKAVVKCIGASELLGASFGSVIRRGSHDLSCGRVGEHDILLLLLLN
jgi:hypothetical protein